MAERYIVVDGSNIATEGRETPSLAQLDEAVRAFMLERAADEEVIVVVDATFGHRIDPSEKPEYEQAERAGEIVSPPAGAIGRGDAFLLQVADRTDAVVLSNDSFQEFHAEYQWLFDEGRLIGGKPVPRVGWFFTPRTPVRGPRSREAIRAAKKARKSSPKRAAVAEGPVAEAIAEATAEAISPDAPADDLGPESDSGQIGRRARRRHIKPVGSVNDPLPFIQFIADHPLGTRVEGEVEGFTSHGAFVRAGDARCYVPLSALGDPAPRSAKAVLTRGEVRTFVVQALDPPRRGIELAMPDVARVAGAPTEETVEADIGAGRKARPRKAKAAAVALPSPVAEPADAPAETPARAAKRSRKKAAAAVEAPAAMAEPAPAVKKARRARKVAAPVEATTPVPVAAPPDQVVEPRKARKAKAKVGAAPGVPPGEEMQPEPVPARARRSRKAAAAVVPVEPEPAPAPKKAARKRSAAKKASAAPIVPEPVAAVPAPAPAKRSRRKSTG